MGCLFWRRRREAIHHIGDGWRLPLVALQLQSPQLYQDCHVLGGRVHNRVPSPVCVLPSPRLRAAPLAPLQLLQGRQRPGQAAGITLIFFAITYSSIRLVMRKSPLKGHCRSTAPSAHSVRRNNCRKCCTCCEITLRAAKHLPLLSWNKSHKNEEK